MGVAEANSATCNPDSSRMSSISDWSIGKPITTQPSSTGARTGTATNCTGLPFRTYTGRRLGALLNSAAIGSSAACSPAVSPWPCQARSRCRTSTHAVTLAPMRSPTFSSAEPSVASSTSEPNAERKP